jgi:hypothetical protein
MAGVLDCAGRLTRAGRRDTEPSDGGRICRMANGLDTTRYHVSAIDPESDERVIFECASLAFANGKAAELRMNGYRQVVARLHGQV